LQPRRGLRCKTEMTDTIAFPAVKQAMILAAGRGARFRPVTDTMPKPLVKLAGKPLIDWQLEMLMANGIERVVINNCYLGEMLRAHIEQLALPLEILFSHEETALETGGGIKHALHHFGDTPFYAVNSDVVMWPKRPDLLRQLDRAFALRPDTRLALLLHPTPGAIGLNGAGDFFCNEHGALWRRGVQKTAPYFFTGIQLMDASVFDDTEQTIFSMNVVYNQFLQYAPEAIAGVVGGGRMLHVGDTEGHAACEAFIAQATTIAPIQ
jgi:N-acetyl-alpha-D-muramate 1-phosphate uridylyltransferase